MTRARETLSLARFEGPHRLQDALLGHPSVLRREPVPLPPGFGRSNTVTSGSVYRTWAWAFPGSGADRILGALRPGVRRAVLVQSASFPSLHLATRHPQPTDSLFVVGGL